MVEKLRMILALALDIYIYVLWPYVLKQVQSLVTAIETDRPGGVKGGDTACNTQADKSSKRSTY
jgi:hypothetical protein